MHNVKKKKIRASSKIKDCVIVISHVMNTGGALCRLPPHSSVGESPPLYIKATDRSQTDLTGQPWGPHNH